MVGRIEDYALIGDTHTAALVGRDGSIDWLCVPRFDSGAVFAALLGGRTTTVGGCWRRPAGSSASSAATATDTLVLETTFHTDTGVVRVIDCMPIRKRCVDVVRVVEVCPGRVPMQMDLRIRFELRLRAAVGGPARRSAACHGWAEHAWCSPRRSRTEGAGDATVADFVVERGERVPFVLTWHPSHEPAPRPDRCGPGDQRDGERGGGGGRSSARSTGRCATLVLRSLITLKALTYAPTGGIVAAPTTSLPEWIGERPQLGLPLCWLRDSVLALDALIVAGFDDEAIAWRDWLLRAACGDPAKLQIMYGLARRATSRRVRARLVARLRGIGAGARRQCRQRAVPARRVRRGARLARPDAQRPPRTGDRRVVAVRGRRARVPRAGLARARRRVVGDAWWSPALHGVEGRRPGSPSARRCVRRSSSSSQVRSSAGGPHATRSMPRCAREGFDPELGSFTQAYGSRQLDASLARHPDRRVPPGHRHRVVRAPSRPSSASCCTTSSSCAIAPTTSTTGCRREKGCSWPARSGSSTSTCCRGASRKPPPSSNASPAWPTTSACWPRSTTRRPSVSSGTSRRRSPTSRSCAPPPISRWAARTSD